MTRIKQFDSLHLKYLAIGGGTGLSTLLRGLKSYVNVEPNSDSQTPVIDNLTAVVTVTDDGGSSGRLRQEFQILPPGDIRNCLVALSEDERLLSRLFQYRFPGEQGGVRGHSFGNLFLAALTGVTGDFVEAIKLCSEVLAIKGHIIPSTTSDVTLIAELEDKTLVRGESQITTCGKKINRIFLNPKNCKPLAETLKAIEQADIITLGPGSLFTSIIPNLLVDGVVEAIKKSSAIKIYICNIMTQPGETDGFSVVDHIRKLAEYLPVNVINSVLVNDEQVASSLQEKYYREGAYPIYLTENEVLHLQNNKCAAAKIAGQLIPITTANLLEQGDLARHAPEKLARAILDIYVEQKIKNVNYLTNNLLT